MNPFDQFDPATQANPFDQFDAAQHPVSGPTGNWLLDAGRNIATGAVKAASGVASRIGQLANDVDTITGRNIPGYAATHPANPAAADPGYVQNNLFNAYGGTEYRPATTLGRMAQGGVEAATLAPLGGEGNSLSSLARTLPSMFGGGATSELAGEMFPNNPLLARLLGFLPGAWATKSALNAPLRPAGSSMDQPTADLAARADDLGIPLAAGQLSGNPFVRYFYSQTGKLPFSGADLYAGTQQEAFNRAVSNSFGENADRITPEVLQSARDRIGDMFNGVAQRTSIPVDNQLMTDLQDVINRARLTMSADSVAPVERQAMNILDTGANNSGNIGGKAYIDLTAKGGPLDAMMQSSDSGIRNAGIQLRGAIDDALSRHATQQDISTLQQARTQWKALKTVEPLTLRADAVGGVAKPSTGDINPAALRSQVNQSYQNAALAPLGQVPLNDLARIGQRFLKEPPDSGTASREMANRAMHTAGSIGAAVMGTEGLEHAFGMPMLSAAGTMAGTLAGARLAQSIMRSPLVARRMIAAGQNPSGFNFAMPSLLGTPAPLALLPPPSSP